MEVTQHWVYQQLHRADGPTPSHAVRKLVRRIGDRAAEVLAWVQDRVPREGWAAWQTITLLGECTAPLSTRRLAHVLIDSPLEMQRPAASHVIARGELAVAPLLEVVDAHPEEIAPILAECGAHERNPVVRAKIREIINRDLELGAACALTFDDPHLVADIMHALLRIDVKQTSAAAIAEATETIWALGVDPGPLGRQRRTEAASQAKMMRV